MREGAASTAFTTAVIACSAAEIETGPPCPCVEIFLEHPQVGVLTIGCGDWVFEWDLVFTCSMRPPPGVVQELSNIVDLVCTLSMVFEISEYIVGAKRCEPMSAQSNRHHVLCFWMQGLTKFACTYA